MADAIIKLSLIDQTKAAIEAAKANLLGLKTTAAEVTGVLAGLGATAWAVDLVAGIHTVLEEWDELGKAAQRAGFESAQSFAEYEFAAKLAGVATNSLETAVGKLAGKMADAVGGGKEAQRTFDTLGVKVRDAGGHLRATEDVLADLAERFASWKDGPEKSALALDLFGKAGKELIPLLNGGRQGLEQLREEFRRLRGQITEENVKAAELFNDNLTRLQTAAGGLKRELAAELLPTLNQITEAMVEQAKKGGLLLGVWAGLAEFARIVTHQTETDHQVDRLKELDAQISITAGKLALLLKSQEKGDSDELREEIKKVRDELSNLQQSALKASAAVKSALNPGYTDADPGSAASSFRRAEILAQGQGKPAAPVIRKDVADAISEYQKLNQELDRRLKLEQAEAAVGGKLSEARKFEVDALAKIEEQTKKLSSAEKVRLEAKVQQVSKEIDNTEKVRKATEDYQKTIEEFYKAEIAVAERDRQVKDEQLAADQRRLDVGKATLEQIEFETSLLSMNTGEREVAIAMRELEKQGIKEGTAAWDMYAAAIKEAVEKRSQLQQSIDNFREIWDSIDRTAHDVWTNIWEGGSDVFKKLRDTLKATVWDLLYQMTVRKWLLNMTVSATSTSAGVANAATGGLVQSGISSLLGGGSLLGDLGASVSGAFSAGMTGSTAFSSALGVGNAGLGASGLAEMASTGSLVGSGGLTGGLTGALSAIPVWGWAALAAAAIFSFMKKGGGDKVGGSAGAYAGDLGLGDISPELSGSLAQVTTGVQAQFDAIAQALGVHTGVQFGMGVVTDPKGKAPSFLDTTVSNSSGGLLGRFLNTNVGRSEDELKAAIAQQSSQAVIAALQAVGSELPVTIRQMLDGISAQALSSDEAQKLMGDITAVIGRVQTLSAALDQTPFKTLAAASFEVKDAFIKAAGGIDAATQALGSYYDFVYTADEKRAQVAENIANRLQQAGLNITSDTVLAAANADDAAARFRSFAESFGEGSPMWNALVSISGAFAGIARQASAAAAAITENDVRSLFMSADEIRNENISTLGSNLRGAGIDVSDQFITGVANSDNPRDLYRQFYLDFKAAGLDSFAQALLDNAQLFAAITPSLDDANNALEQFNQHMADLASSWYDNFTPDAQKRIDTATAIAGTLSTAGYAITSDQVLGMTKEDWAALMASFKAGGTSGQHFVDVLLGLGDSINSITDWTQVATDATDHHARALRKVSDATTEIQRQWGQLADTLMDAVHKIRGEIVASSPNSFAALQTQFALTTAAARAGDLAAGQRLPGLEQALLDAGAGRARSLSDLQLLRARTANSLELTAGAARSQAADPVVSELRQLRAENVKLRQQHEKHAKVVEDLDRRTTKIFEKWDKRGLPATTVD